MYRMNNYFPVGRATIIKIFPQHQSVAAGTTVTFTCKSDRHVKWLYERRLPRNAKIIIKRDRTILKLRKVKLHNAGTYVCFGHDDDIGYYEDDAVLTIIGKYY